MDFAKLVHWVTLSRSPQTSGDSDGFFEPLSPARVPAAITPVPGDERSTFHQVTIRYHPQVTADVRLLFGVRELYVRNVVNVDERNNEMRLFCEEVRA